jgi:hypothetical protein
MLPRRVNNNNNPRTDLNLQLLPRADLNLQLLLKRIKESNNRRPLSAQLKVPLQSQERRTRRISSTKLRNSSVRQSLFGLRDMSSYFLFSFITVFVAASSAFSVQRKWNCCSLFFVKWINQSFVGLFELQLLSFVVQPFDLFHICQVLELVSLH